MRIKIIHLVFLSLAINFSSWTFLNAQLPTIVINTNEEIPDEPKVPGTFTYTDGNGVILTSNIGIEIRGGFSQTFPKKTYDLEFWNDPTGSETIDVQFGDMREDDDWILDAMYNEPLRINSFIAHKLWLDMNELYYQDQEPKAKSGADVMYVEVTINNEYQGVFLLSEQVDRSQLKLKKNSSTQIRGELYKAYTWDDAILFNNPDQTPNNNSLNWSGYEYRYPTDIVDWSNIEELVKFVANSSDEEFANEIGDRFDINNLMDYFILLNVARILDNRGKNIYLCRYDVDEPYFFAPWDLDGSWGLLWNGNNDTTTKEPLTNNLYDRLIATNADDFRQNVSDRWNNLRSTLLSDEALSERINSAHDFLFDNGLYDKEESAWEYVYSESDLDYLFNWLEKRIDFLDVYFGDITAVDNIEYAESFGVFPNPTFDFISIKGDHNKNDEVKIINLLGEQIASYRNIDSGDQINVSNLNSGMYILDAGSNKTVFYKY